MRTIVSLLDRVTDGSDWRPGPTTNESKPYVCSCGHAFVLHEVDEDWQVAACCVDGCSCGHETTS